MHGTFKLKRGSIRFDPDTGKASGEIVIDVASGASGNGLRDRRMHKEILESQKYPEAVLRRTSAWPPGQSELDVHGVLTIHGAEHEMTLHFLVAEGGHYTASTHFSIPYVAVGHEEPSNFLLKVDNKVEMEVKADEPARKPAQQVATRLPGSPIGRDLAFRQQLAFFQMPRFGGEVGGVRVVRHHHDGLAELLVQARAAGSGHPARKWRPGCRWARRRESDRDR